MGPFFSRSIKEKKASLKKALPCAAAIFFMFLRLKPIIMSAVIKSMLIGAARSILSKK